LPDGRRKPKGERETTERELEFFLTAERSGGYMHFDMHRLEPRNRYKLLTGVVVPRPIALVTSLDLEGQVNAAPFSFFNAMGSDPPIVAFSPGMTKHTYHNVKVTQEFVVNLVSEGIAEAMNITATDFPEGVNELEPAGLTTLPSRKVKVPRIAQSPVNLECRLNTILEIGMNRVVIGEVLEIHIWDEFVDAEKFYVRTNELRLIGRMGGLGGYTNTRDAFEIPRVSYTDWLEREKK
jgi:flavin reductase (DIM6/NTAB) family NADH-FMN oxidoreductase RutF